MVETVMASECFQLGTNIFRFNHSDDPDSQLLDAYVNVDCDEYHVGQTVTRPKTKCPVWNEDYQVGEDKGKWNGRYLKEGRV